MGHSFRTELVEFIPFQFETNCIEVNHVLYILHDWRGNRSITFARENNNAEEIKREQCERDRKRGREKSKESNSRTNKSMVGCGTQQGYSNLFIQQPKWLKLFSPMLVSQIN